jgi:hypothetical protein
VEQRCFSKGIPVDSRAAVLDVVNLFDIVRKSSTVGNFLPPCWRWRGTGSWWICWGVVVMCKVTTRRQGLLSK